MDNTIDTSKYRVSVPIFFYIIENFDYDNVYYAKVTVSDKCKDEYPTIKIRSIDEANVLISFEGYATLCHKNDVLDNLFNTKLYRIKVKKGTPVYKSSSGYVYAHEYEIIEQLDLDDINILSRLLEEGAEIPKETTILIPYCIKGNLEAVKLLIEHGASVNINIPLKRASKNGHFEIVKYLVEQGAIIDDECIKCAESQQIKEYLKNKKGE